MIHAAYGAMSAEGLFPRVDVIASGIGEEDACVRAKSIREKLPRWGAIAGAVMAWSMIRTGRFSMHKRPVSAFAESMTVGYLSGYLLAPLITGRASGCTTDLDVWEQS